MAEPPCPEQLASFLERKRLAVLDVARGSLAGSRRLLVGRPGDPTVTHAVAVVHSEATTKAVDTEQAVLGWAPARLRPQTLATLPRVVQRVAVDRTRTGLVVTGVPGLRPAEEHRATLRPHTALAAASPWLSAVWEDSAGERRPVDVGRAARERLRARYRTSPTVADALLAVELAFRRLTAVEVPQTLTHGCLCTRHLKIEGNAVVGVDDWGQASVASDPLRELGHLATDVAGCRLSEVLLGRTAFASMVREFVTAGLDRVGLPHPLWRDVLLLSQTERAARALELGDGHPLHVLITAARARPVRLDRKKGTP